MFDILFDWSACFASQNASELVSITHSIGLITFHAVLQSTVFTNRALVNYFGFLCSFLVVLLSTLVELTVKVKHSSRVDLTHNLTGRLSRI